MKMVEIAVALCAALAAALWAGWVLDGGLASVQAAVGLAGALAGAFAIYMIADRALRLVWLRLGCYGAALMVCAATVWVEAGALVDGGVSFAAISAEVERRSPHELFLLTAPLPGAAVLLALALELVLGGLRHLHRTQRRRRADSELYGKARLLPRRYLRRLSRGRGIVLGGWGGGRNAPLIAYPLEGSALTVAPPRAGKGALIALNLLSPESRGFEGSCVIIDPRGELWCIAARRRRELGRDVLLVDPFAVVRGHKAAYGDALYLPASASAPYNPLDFIRDEEALAVRDIHVLLDALLTPPPNDAHQNTRHFYESARAIIAGYVAWVRFHEPPGQRTLGRVYELLSQPPAGREQLAARVMEVKRFAGGLAHIAFERQAQVGPEEGGGTFTTIANQLAFLNFPELVADTAVSSFDPMMLAEGNTDLFVVAPEELIDHVKGWLRLWVTVPNAVASRGALERDLLIIIDEMPRLGYLKPVMDGYNMAAGKGVHFWCFAQSLSALDDTWGEGRRKTLMYLAEVVQILGLPRADPDGAEQLSKAIGGATFESRTENRSGSVAGVGVVEANTQWQAGESYSLVRERLVMPDELMTLGPDRQYVITTSKDMPRDALHLHHARYWRRSDAGWLADPNPFVLRKENSSGARALRQQRQRDPDGAVFAPGPGDKTHG